MDKSGVTIRIAEHNERQIQNDVYKLVGIGAFAGGLEALQTHLCDLPGNLDFAYANVQHLSPDYKSLLGEILSQYTAMPVAQAEDGMEITASTVYLIKPKFNLTVRADRIRLTQYHGGLNIPIGMFFISLVEVEKEKASAVIFMEIRMPEMDGLEATKAIRTLDRPGAKTIPIAAMSANAFEEDVQISLDAGMNAHLAKPIKPQKLYEMLAELVALH